MPTSSDIDRLKKLAGEGEDLETEEPRDSNVHVSVNLHHHGRNSERAKESIKTLLESPWARAVFMIALGVGGSETHRIFAAAGIVQKSELEEHKKKTQRQMSELQAKVVASAKAECEKTDADLYSISRYLYHVLPRAGVLVTLQEGVPPPASMEFHPVPLKAGVKPNQPKPIQPKETFPLPRR